MKLTMSGGRKHAARLALGLASQRASVRSHTYSPDH